jgi:hypothetical protein
MLSSKSINAKLQSSNEQMMAFRIIQITFPNKAKSLGNPSGGNSIVVKSVSTASSKTTKEVHPSQ